MASYQNTNNYDLLKDVETKKIYPYEKVNNEIIKENLKYEEEDLAKSSKGLITLSEDEINNHKSVDTMSYYDSVSKDKYESIQNIKKIIEEDQPNFNNRSCLSRWFDKITGGSLRGSIFAIASVTFGGGCLAFPNAIAKVGPLLGFTIFLLSAYLSYVTAIYIIEAGINNNCLDYNELVKRASGDKMRVFADINNIILCIGVIMSYQYMVYQFIEIILLDLFGVVTTTTIKVITYLICSIFIQIPLSLIKNISILQYASITATVSLAYIILLILCESPMYFSQNYNTGPKYELSLLPPDGIGFDWLNTVSTFLFGFCLHNGIFQVFMEMDRPNLRRSKKVINRATILEIFLYISIAAGGFFSTFYASPDVFIKRTDLTRYNRDYFMLIGKLSLVVVLNCCMSINYNIMRLSIRSMVFNNEIPSNSIDFFITVCVYILSNLITFFVEDVTAILGIVGGISTVVISFLCPILIKIKLDKNITKNTKLLNYIFLVIICILGTGCTIKGFYDYISNLGKKTK